MAKILYIIVTFTVCIVSNLYGNIDCNIKMELPGIVKKSMLINILYSQDRTIILNYNNSCIAWKSTDVNPHRYFCFDDNHNILNIALIENEKLKFFYCTYRQFETDVSPPKFGI